MAEGEAAAALTDRACRVDRWIAGSGADAVAAGGSAWPGWTQQGKQTQGYWRYQIPGLRSGRLMSHERWSVTPTWKMRTTLGAPSGAPSTTSAMLASCAGEGASEHA